MRISPKRVLAYATLTALSACAVSRGEEEPKQGYEGHYFPVAPARPGTLELQRDGSFYLHLPAGLLDDGTPFVATGTWRPRVDEWSDMEPLRSLVMLVVTEWGGEQSNRLEVPLYWQPDGLALMGPCMTWVFTKWPACR